MRVRAKSRSSQMLKTETLHQMHFLCASVRQIGTTQGLWDRITVRDMARIQTCAAPTSATSAASSAKCRPARSASPPSARPSRSTHTASNSCRSTDSSAMWAGASKDSKRSNNCKITSAASTSAVTKEKSGQRLPSRASTKRGPTRN